MEKPVRSAAFYKFVPLPEYRELRSELLAICRALPVRGTILLSSEGINGTIAGDGPPWNRRFHFCALIRVWPTCWRRILFTMIFPSADEGTLKREIVAMKAPDIDPRARAGSYVEPEDWNRLITEDDVLLLDARNDYEVRMGTFSGSRNPETESFHECRVI